MLDPVEQLIGPDILCWSKVVGSWDCAALVRGEDRYGHFALTPQPSKDFDPPAVEFHAQAAKAMRDVLYAGAERKLGRL